MRLKQVLTRLRERGRSAKGLMDALAYRVPLLVTQIVVFRSGDCYPRCPRCQCSMEREYQHFCDRCGQNLNWSLLPYAEKIEAPLRTFPVD